MLPPAMMKILRWALPVTTLAGGLSLGAWLSGSQIAADAPALVAKNPARVTAGAPPPPRLATSVGGWPTEEEAVREDEARRLWQSGGLEPTLEVLSAYAQVNPARALDLAMTLEGDNAWELVMKLVQTLPLQAGGVAMDVLLRHPRYCKTGPPQHAVFFLCAKSDPERAWREAHASGVDFTKNALDAIASACGETNGRKGMELAARLTGAKEQTNFTRAVLRSWVERDARDVVAWLGSQPDAARFHQQIPWGSMRFASQEDFLAMVRLVPLEVLKGSTTHSFTFGTAPEDGWATRLDWLQAITDEAPRRALFEGAARALAHADPEKALALLPEISDARLRQQITSVTAAYRAAASPAAGLAYAESLADESARLAARQSVMNTWAESDPAAAARYALESGLTTGNEFTMMRQQLGRKWAELDPQGAVSYALEHEPQNTNQATPDSLLSAAMRQWMVQDPYSASSYVSSLPAGAARDATVATLAHAAINLEPVGAMTWAANIADAEVRQRTMQNCFATWLRTDQDNAARWLEQASVEPPVRQIMETAVQAAAARQRSSYPSQREQGGVILVY